jgi:hypothetical protein
MLYSPEERVPLIAFFSQDISNIKIHADGLKVDRHEWLGAELGWRCCPRLTTAV